jgi:hypothetical protein
VNIGQGEAGVDADPQLETHPIELPWWTMGGSSGPHEDHRPKDPS